MSSQSLLSHITNFVGNTPLVAIQRIFPREKDQAQIFCKLEFFNPAGSVKDRIGYNMLKTAREQGKIGENSLIIESTSGNTGIALAWVCSSLGYRLALTMPESMSKERILTLKALGAEIHLTPAHLGMQGSIDKAEELFQKNKDSFMTKQFENPSNPEIHKNTTAKEILKDTQNKVDIFVAGVGTGGTITGVGEVLKSQKPHAQIVAVEPSDSAVLSGKPAGPHSIQGIGAGFIPPILNRNVIDEVICVTNQQAQQTTRLLALREGIFSGISGGANVYAAHQLALRPENKGKTIVSVICDLGDRYLSMNVF